MPIMQVRANTLGTKPEDRIAELEHENAKLNKMVQVLMERVERNVDQQGDAFTLFQTAITLEETVRIITEIQEPVEGLTQLLVTVRGKITFS